MIKEMFSIIPDTVDQMSLDFLSKGLEEHQTEKFDYIKYRSAINSLSQMNMDLETARQSTLTTASTMGITMQDIQRSAKQFLDVLNKEENAFSSALQNQYHQKVSQKKDELNELHNQIRKWQQQIEQLNQQIQDATLKLTTEEAEIESNDQKIQAKKEQFNQTLSWLRQRVQEDIEDLS